MSKRFKDIFGYRIFSSVGIFIVLVGVMMIIFDRKSSSDIGMKYGPYQPSNISGYEVIILGVILLVGVLIFYTTQRGRK